MTSIVNNSTFNGGKYGVVNWNCTNVQITNNDFSNTSNSCIVTEKGQFLIEGNTFNSGVADIHFASISPGFGTYFNNNDFNGSCAGIQAVGTSFGEHIIDNNQFQTGRLDLFIDGDNNFLFRENNIISDLGAVFVDNGNHFNEVHSNNITGNFVGLMPLGNNPGYLFHNNCYNTSSYDNYIQGEIAKIKAGKNLGTNMNKGANNCFTHGGMLNHSTVDISGNPDPFVYVEPAYNILPNCLNAENAHPNVTRVFSNFVYQSPCSLTAGGVDSSQHNTPCNPESSIQATEASIDTLEAIISTIQNDQSLSDDERQSFSQFYKNCLKRVKWIWAEVMLRENNFQELRNEFLTDSISDDVILTIYSSYLFENKLDSAESYLLSQTNTSSKSADFITIQSIDLERMQNLGSFSATDSVLNIVETIALKRHAYSGYAKSLYFWLTEEIIFTELRTNITDEEAIPQMSESEEIISKIEISPNPFKDPLFIRYPIGSASDLMIMDILGNVLVNRSIEGDVKLITSKWNSGLYIVLVNSKDEMLFQGKFVLTR